MPFIDAKDGTKIFYKDWGTGTPVVLIHGWPVSADMWEYQAPALVKAGHRVIAYDRRGFGRSEQPWSGYDYDTMADDLGAVMDKLDLNGAALVGFSMGGGEVARSLSRPGQTRVTRAVLVSSVVPGLLKTPDNPDGTDRSVFDEMVAGLQKDRPNFLQAFGKQFMGAGLLNFMVSSAFLESLLMLAMQASPQATIDCVRAFSETDFRADCAAIRVPTLVIHGASDATVPPDVGRKAANLIAGATYLEYEGAPHGLFFTDKDRLTADLLQFLGR